MFWPKRFKPATHDHYMYVINWYDEQSEYVGLCAEFPSLTWFAKTPELALKGIRNVVKDTVKDMIDNNEPLPKPFKYEELE